MNGITMTAPFSLAETVYKQISIFDLLEIENTEEKPEPELDEIPCRIFDWRSNKSIEFRSMVKGNEIMDTTFKNAFEYKVIYVFTIDDQAHNGLVKIGDATLHTVTPVDQLTPNSRELNQAALKRIRAYTNTAGLTPHLLHSEIAVRTVKDKNGTLKIEAFRDHHVHEVLKNSGYTNVQLGESSGKEWFSVDLQTAQKAIDAVKKNYSNLSNSDIVKHSPIIFRPEQAACITKVVKHFKKADRFLINAKMRYGKTFVSLEIVKQCKFKKLLF